MTKNWLVWYNGKFTKTPMNEEQAKKLAKQYRLAGRRNAYAVYCMS